MLTDASGIGGDTMVGGAGNDTYIVTHSGDIIAESAGAGTDLVSANVSYALATNVEQLTLFGGSAITGTGNTGDNIITDNGAADTLVGLAGNDTYIVTNASDIVTEALPPVLMWL